MEGLNYRLALVLVWSLVAVHAAGQPPKKISYQAIVRDNAGHVITSATVSMRISIVQGSAEGPAVYVESHTAQSNTHGVVSLQIGGGSGTVGSLEDIEWSQGPYFIRTGIDPQGGTNYTITLTSELLSVPYALFALDQGVAGPVGPQGPEGAQGPQGPQGAQGAGIERVEDNGMGMLTFHFDDGTSYTTPVLTGPQGPQGSHDLTPYAKTADLPAAVPDHEADPVFAQSPSSAITADQIANWQASHGWGDHGVEGYLKIENQGLANTLEISTDAQGQPMENLSKLSVGRIEPVSSAVLQIVSESKGFLIPRMTSRQVQQIQDPAQGLMIYNTDTKVFQYFDGTLWQDINRR